MTHASYVLSGWLVVGGGLAGYAAHLMRRGRRLSRLVPPERRRWS